MNSYLYNDNTLIDTGSLPDDIFMRVDNGFFDIVNLIGGDSLCKILRIQMINSARKLLNTADVFAFFQIESEQIDALKAESCFKCRNGQYVVKPGIQTSLNYLINLLRQKQEQDQNSRFSNNNNFQSNYIDDDFINKHPLLRALIDWYRHNDLKVDEKSNDFLMAFIEGVVFNVTRSSNRFRYAESVKRFAICLYIFGGKQCYEYVRLNLPGAIPHLSTVIDLINRSDMMFSEAEFKFDLLRKFHYDFGFCSEDTTGVIPKIEYDSSTDSFIGFTTPIMDGIPIKQSYLADTFDNLKAIYDESKIAPLLNIHMFQGLSAEDGMGTFHKPVLLSAYGVDSTYTTIDILRRWMWIFDNSLRQGVRIIGFSTDADSKYLSAMRLASGFFASLPNFELIKHQNAFQINIPNDWTWFLLNTKQLFLFFQDPIHLVTKWRNRMLSTKADLCIGNDKISIGHLENLIDDNGYSKLDHCLTKSDINPKDRQNYASCIKLISDDVLSLLNEAVGANGTVVYLKLLKMIVRAYVDPSTSIRERVESAWCVVFVCRLWWTWLQKVPISSSSNNRKKANNKKNKTNKFFITKPAYMSVELNAHNLLYMIVLVKQKQLPKQALINIHLFSSQPCESLFRDARSLNGCFSTMLNFTVKSFIKRSQKILILNKLKYNQREKDLAFPTHHKRKLEHSAAPMDLSHDIDKLNISELISNAYDQALNMVRHSNILDTLNHYHLNTLHDLSKYVMNMLNDNSKLINYSSLTESSNNEEFGLDDENENDDSGAENYMSAQSYKTVSSEVDNDLTSDEEEDACILNSKKSDFSGIRIVEDVNPTNKHSYFKVKINDNIRYLHKQSACWLLSNSIKKLSNDRTHRVIQQTAKNK